MVRFGVQTEKTETYVTYHFSLDIKEIKKVLTPDAQEELDERIADSVSGYLNHPVEFNGRLLSKRHKLFFEFDGKIISCIPLPGLSSRWIAILKDHGRAILYRILGIEDFEK